ncbi:PQQ-dependent sugar dehydrogenase [Vibrio tapetis]|uniref:Glucose/Sorbosone dehydrogenase domain-containing protein n=1 Tax=Vibrio tapetis subsp. tapetis TaxID=1671868 RepID=A0A2N8ZL19_9VIBR|nr:PQQ-dependent sugar dehydrogenase [Vibrio tapetis]SON52605.1 conserved exported protein of unknown function [Vibrio tapetis subsp. tapetis]
MRKLLQFGLLTLTCVSANSAYALQAKKITSDLDAPWGLTYINSETMLVTQKGGEVKHINLATGTRHTLFKAPDVWVNGQGGLLDITLSPKDNHTLYFTYSKSVDGDGVTTLATAQYQNQKITDWQDVFISKSRTDTSRHFGSRITFDAGHLYFSIGDRGERENGQNTLTHAGSILRLNLDGSVPQDNPYVTNSSALNEIWSYGHRNPQGLFFDFDSQQLWSIEHGPRGGDEINRIIKGANYGWPVTSHGKEYWGPIRVGEAEEKDGIESPVKVYIPSIAPSSLVLYRGEKFPELNGKLLAGALKLTHINVITIDVTKNQTDKNEKHPYQAAAEDRLFEELNERIRDIETTPDGNIFFITDSGNLYQITR